jgi:hypothetical protein
MAGIFTEFNGDGELAAFTRATPSQSRGCTCLSPEITP